MLMLDLPRLEREGTLEFGGEIPPDAPLWEGSDLHFRGPLKVSGTARLAGSGEILVDTRIEGELQQECRRCLAPVITRVESTPMFVFGEADEEGGEDGEIRRLDVEATELDLGEAVREELILTLDPFVLCDPDCKGLCPRCGIDRNRETCDCVLEEKDPRWDALRALRNE
ncbi:MAG: DUF177 domain-containing protein [Gemmatimonadota bacterium]|jgi:uncharacterized protein